MIKTAITGNIASGKSQVENFLISLGFSVIDSDKINHNLIMYNSDVISELKNTFGDEIIENSVISKEKLAQIVFNIPQKKSQLEQILHYRIKKAIDTFFEQHKNENIVFASVPLLFEAEWEKNFDKIIFVSADENIRLKRLMNRNNYSFDVAKKRIMAQDAEKSKIKKSDFVILNNSDLENLKHSTLLVIEQLKSLNVH